MAQQQSANPQDQAVIGEEINKVRLITLNRPRQLNTISSKVVSLLAEYLEKWERDDNAELVIFKGDGRAFSAGGDLNMFYDGRNSDDSCLDVVYRMYWLCYHNHTYKKTQDLKTTLKTFGSNIIFSNGLLDPWSGGSVLHNVSETVVALVTKLGAHHIDLRAATNEDPDWLIEQRATEIKLIKDWINNYYQEKKTASLSI